MLFGQGVDERESRGENDVLNYCCVGVRELTEDDWDHVRAYIRIPNHEKLKHSKVSSHKQSYCRNPVSTHLVLIFKGKDAHIGE